MIIKNGRVFQEDGTFAEKDLYIEGKRFVSTKEEVIDQIGRASCRERV